MTKQFNISTPSGMKQVDGKLVVIPKFKEVKAFIHRGTRSEWDGKRPWVISEFESGAAITQFFGKQSGALQEASYVIEKHGLERLISQMTTFIMQYGRANQ